MNKLNILKEPPPLNKQQQFKQKTKEHFEKLWELDPEQFNPIHKVRELERIKRTENLIRKHIEIKDIRIVDLGCGYGTLLRQFTGLSTIAVDVAEHPLKLVQTFTKTIRDCIPYTLLDDDAFDLVLSTDLIAELPEELYRLYFLELSRLVKRDGFVICSTPIDIRSDDALQRFSSLAETELNIVEWTLSRHAYHIKLTDFFKAPQRKLKNGGSKWLWKPLASMFSPVVHLLEHNRFILFKLEQLATFFSPETSISHAIFIAKRRPLFESKEEFSQEPKIKKKVWE